MSISHISNEITGYHAYLSDCSPITDDNTPQVKTHFARIFRHHFQIPQIFQVIKVHQIGGHPGKIPKH